MADEPLQLDLAVGLGDDPSADELDWATRRLRFELEDADLGEVALAEGGPAPEGTRGAGAVVPGALSLSLLPGAWDRLAAVVRDWARRREGRTLRLAYGAGENRLELEYDPEKTDINQVMALLLERGGRAAGGISAGGDVVGGDKTSHVSAGADAVGRDKITEIHVAAGSTLIINDPALTAAPQVNPPGPADPLAPPNTD